MRRRPIALAAAGLGVLLAALVLQPVLVASINVAAVPDPPGLPIAEPVAPVRTIGPLFAGDARAPDAVHHCTGSVIDSPARDLVLTAAHCVTGSGTDLSFAPGAADGATPYGVWHVSAVYLDPAWTASADPRYDYAFLQLAPDGGRRLEDVTGSEVLDTTLSSPVTVVGYPAGTGGRPVACRTPVFRTGGYPTFPCRAIVGGASGSPWLRPVRGGPPHVVGVVGGLEQGGCQDFITYSSPFGPDIVALWQRAGRQESPDVAPPVPDLQC